ncbi:MAG: T9SS type A sorting domain-containing protein [Bacteroidia bacterium]|nr:T9SS type A sorting domain-containing protein [Bacteroidia bacterium]
MKTTTLNFTAMVIALCLLAAANRCSAQITYTQSDLPKAGVIYYRSTDSSTSLSPGSGGAAQTWNLTPLTASSKDTLKVLNPAGTPYSGKFPSANLAAEIGSTGVYDYLTESGSSLQLNGAWSAATQFEFIPDWTMLSLPATYNTKWMGTFKDAIKMAYPVPPYDSVEVVSHTNYYDTVDGYGSATTPYKTFSNTLRLVEVDRGIDSTYLQNASTHVWSSFGAPTKSWQKTFTWYDANDFQVAKATLKDSTATTYSYQWLTNIVAGINEVTLSNQAKIYPNPATDELNIQVTKPGAKYFNVFDITGKEMFSTEISATLSQVNVSGLANGLYLYSITDMNGTTTGSGKFIIGR